MYLFVVKMNLYVKFSMYMHMNNNGGYIALYKYTFFFCEKNKPVGVLNISEMDPIASFTSIHLL